MINNLTKERPNILVICFIFCCVFVASVLYTGAVMWILTGRAFIPVSPLSAHDILIVSFALTSVVLLLGWMKKIPGRDLLVTAFVIEIFYTLLIIVLNNYVILFPEVNISFLYMFVWVLGFPSQILGIFGISKMIKYLHV